MKNSNDTIGNRTLNLPLCSAVPKPTAPPGNPPPPSFFFPEIKFFGEKGFKFLFLIK